MASVNNSSWITNDKLVWDSSNPERGIFSFKVSENTSTEERIANVTFQDVNDPSVKTTLKIIQSAKPIESFIKLNLDETDIPYQGRFIDFNISASTNITETKFTNNPTWTRIDKLDEFSGQIYVCENTDANPRSGVIKLVGYINGSTSNTVTDTVTLIQQGTTPTQYYCLVNPSASTFGSESDTGEFSVSANTLWNIYNDGIPPWIQDIEPMFGPQGNTDVTYYISENETDLAPQREGYIKVVVTNSVYGTHKVIQKKPKGVYFTSDSATTKNVTYEYTQSTNQVDIVYWGIESETITVSGITGLDWISVSESSKSGEFVNYSITVQKNDSTSDRNCTIWFMMGNTVVSPKATLSLKQNGKTGTPKIVIDGLSEKTLTPTPFSSTTQLDVQYLNRGDDEITIVDGEAPNIYIEGGSERQFNSPFSSGTNINVVYENSGGDSIDVTDN